jgi:hypothetical protein
MHPAAPLGRLIEFRDLHPIQQRVGRDADRLRCLIDVALRQQRGEAASFLCPKLVP